MKYSFIIIFLLAQVFSIQEVYSEKVQHGKIFSSERDTNQTITPNQYKKGSDSDRIEQAIREALERGVNSIQIPRYDEINQKTIWLIDRAILLPSDFTLVLNDCLVRLAPGAQDNIITNSGARTKPLSQNENIRIIGRGNAVLSGGLETHFNPPGDISGYRTIGILLNETQNFTIEGIKMEETQAWAILAEGCAYGKIFDIDFHNSAKYPNQDGIDLNCCHDIMIENITGITGDDMIALVGSRSDESLATSKDNGTATQRMTVGRTGEMTDDDIYNIFICNVKGTTVGNCAIIRLLNMDGVKMYNILINNILDTSKIGGKGNSNAILIGDVRYWTIRQSKPGETSRIFINNVVSRANTVVQVRGTLTDSILDNIVGYGDNNQVVEYWDESQVKNVKVDAHKF